MCKFEKDNKKLERIKIPENKEIATIYKNFSFTLIIAFFTYTPFIKPEICIRISIFLLQTISKLFRKQFNHYISILYQVKKESRNLKLNLSH